MQRWLRIREHFVHAADLSISGVATLTRDSQAGLVDGDATSTAA